MATTHYLCISVIQSTLVFYCVLLRFVDVYAQCRRENGQFAEEKRCVRNLTCLQYKEKIDISWNHPQDDGITLDYYLIISGIPAIALLKSNNSVTVNASSTTPRIDFNRFYNVTVRRRYTQSDFNKDYRITKECTKVQKSTLGVSATPAQVTIIQGNVDTKNDESENPDLGGDYGNIIIGLCVAVLAVSIIIVILAIRYVKKKRMRNINGKRPSEKPHGDLRGLKDDTNEEDTYNRLTLRYQENTAKQERISQDTYAHITETETQGQGENLLQAAHAPITHRYDGNYDDIPYEFEKTEKTETASTNEPLMQGKPKVEDSKPDDVKGPLTGDVYATVDKGNPQQIEDGLNRAEGPQGDLYTEVAIKR